MKEKIKKFSKYFMNIMAFINMILVGLSKVWGWNINNIIESIIVVNGAVGAYLVSGKIFEDNSKEEQELLEERDEE